MKLNLLSIFAIALVTGEITDLAPNSMSSYEPSSAVQQSSAITHSKVVRHSKCSGKSKHSKVKHTIAYELKFLISEYHSYVKIHGSEDIIGFFRLIAVSEVEAQKILINYTENKAKFQANFEAYLEFVYYYTSFQLKAEFRSSTIKTAAGGASGSIHPSGGASVDFIKIEKELKKFGGSKGSFDVEGFFKNIVSGDRDVKKIEKKYEEFKHTGGSGDISAFLHKFIAENNFNPEVKFDGKFSYNTPPTESYEVKITPGSGSGTRKVTHTSQSYESHYSSKQIEVEITQAESAYEKFVAKFGSEDLTYFFKLIASETEAVRINIEFTKYIQNHPDDIVGFLRYIISTGEFHFNFNINFEQEHVPSSPKYEFVPPSPSNGGRKPSVPSSEILRKIEITLNKYIEVYHHDFTILFQKIVPKKEVKTITEKYNEFIEQGRGDIFAFFKLVIESNEFHLNFNINFSTHKVTEVEKPESPVYDDKDFEHEKGEESDDESEGEDETDDEDEDKPEASKYEIREPSKITVNFEKINVLIQSYIKVYKKEYTQLFWDITSNEEEANFVYKKYVEFTQQKKGDIYAFFKFIIESKQLHFQLNFNVPAPKDKKVIKHEEVSSVKFEGEGEIKHDEEDNDEGEDDEEDNEEGEDEDEDNEEGEDEDEDNEEGEDEDEDNEEGENEEEDNEEGEDEEEDIENDEDEKPEASKYEVKENTKVSINFEKIDILIKKYIEVYQQDFSILFREITPTKKEANTVSKKYIEFIQQGRGDIFAFIKFITESKQFNLNFNIKIPSSKKVVVTPSGSTGGKVKVSTSGGLKLKVEHLVQGYEAYFKIHGDNEIKGFFDMIAITSEDADIIMGEYKRFVAEHGNDDIHGFFSIIVKTHTFKSHWSHSSTKSSFKFSGSSSSSGVDFQKLIKDFTAYIKSNGADNLEGFFKEIGASQTDSKKITNIYKQFQNQNGVNDVGGFFNVLFTSNSFNLKWEYSSKSSGSTTTTTVVDALPQSVVKKIDEVVEEVKVNGPSGIYAESKVTEGPSTDGEPENEDDLPWCDEE